MQRIVEPELMDDLEQAEAYTSADFSRSHNQRVEVFRKLYPKGEVRGEILDLGCGSGDMDFRFLNAFPECTIVAVDGAKAMVDLGRQAASANERFKNRIDFVECYIPSPQIPRRCYSTLMSHSFLHHLHDPRVLWDTISILSQPGTFIFVSDLCSPKLQR